MTKSWTEQFDEKFCMPKEYFNGEFIEHATYAKDIKSFISNLLDKQRKEIVEDVEEMEVVGWVSVSEEHLDSDSVSMEMKDIGQFNLIGKDRVITKIKGE